MSGAAGLSAARRRRGTQASKNISDVLEEPAYNDESVGTLRRRRATLSSRNVSEKIEEPTHIVEEVSSPIHPIQQLHIHERKLDGLLAHIQALGKAFMEHRAEVALAIPQLQEAVEELLHEAQMPSILDNTAVDEDEAEEEEEDQEEKDIIEETQNSVTHRFMMSMTKELSDRLTLEAEAKTRLELKLEQVDRSHAETQARLSETELEIVHLKKQLANNHNIPPTNLEQNVPTFPDTESLTETLTANIVKEIMGNVSEGNIILENNIDNA